MNATSLLRGLLLPMLAISALAMSHRAAAQATGADVDCMLPGEIHSVGGHPSMGPRHAVQTTAEDCQQRGGEYTVYQAPAVSSRATTDTASDSTPVRCLLPKQTRQLGSKARYQAHSRTIHTTASDCSSKQGKVLPATTNKTHH